MEVCVTVELLPLELPELLVAVVNDVSVEIRDGDVRLALAAARTSWWSSITSSSPDDELDESPLGCDTVRRCLCWVLPEESSREIEELYLELVGLVLALLELLLALLFGLFL
jgi:hypothetical protein